MPTTSLSSGGSFGGLSPALRWGVVRFGRFSDVGSLVKGVAGRFAELGGDLIAQVSQILRDGVIAAQTFVESGQLTQSILDIVPQIPVGTFSLPPSDRIILSGNLVGTSDTGDVLARRTYQLGLDLNALISDLLSSGARKIYQRIVGSDPDAAEKFVNQFFEAHWMGKIW